MKKNYLIKAVSLICILVVILIPAISSAEGELNVSYNETEKTVTLSATVCEKENIAVAIKISKDTENTIVTVIRSDKGGKILHKEKMPANFDGGRYDVTVAAVDSSPLSNYFIYPIESEIESILPLINGAESSEALVGIMKDNSNALAIDLLVFEPVAQAAGEIFYSLMPKEDITTASEYLTLYNNSLAAVALKNGTNTALVLAKYGAAIGVEESVYTLLEEDEKSIMDSYALNADYKKRTVKAVLMQGKAVSQINVAESWSDLKEKVVENEEVLDFDKEYFDKVELKDKVYQKMYSALDGDEDIADIKIAFSTASKKCYDEENKPASSTPAPSGGGPRVPKPSPVVPSQPTDSESTEEKSYSDVNEHWAKDYILNLSGKNIINGYTDGTFKPNENVTRAQFATMVVRALSLETKEINEKFTDVKPGSWYYDAVMIASEAGFINGLGDGIFSPDEEISRQDAFVIIERAFKESLAKGDAKAFSDSSDISAYAQEAVELLSSSGIVKGNEEGKLLPKNKISRAEAAALMSRILSLGKE